LMGLGWILGVDFFSCWQWS